MAFRLIFFVTFSVIIFLLLYVSISYVTSTG